MVNHSFQSSPVSSVNQLLPVFTTIRSKGRLLDLSKPVVMGILNVSDKSFYKTVGDDTQELLSTAAKMIEDGATILDIGGTSTRPGEKISNATDEAGRVIPAIKAIKSQFPDVWISIDTYHSSVAQKAIEAGADIVNDVSAGNIDADMITTVGTLKVPYIAMHMQGTPETMQLSPTYDNVVVEVLDFMKNKLEECRNAGIVDVIFDPGFGFGKTVEHNFELLRNLDVFRMTQCPILAGLSRKSMICKALNIKPTDALNGTTVLNTLALQKGASILRVHDVKEAYEAIRLLGWF